jgi:hypothetical protein
MGVICFLGNAPDITNGVCSGCKFELRFANQKETFVTRQEISVVEIHSTVAMPNDYLANGEAFYDFRAILKQTVLHSPFVVVKNRPVLSEEPHHRGKTFALPFHVLVIRHRVVT